MKINLLTLLLFTATSSIVSAQTQFTAKSGNVNPDFKLGNSHPKTINIENIATKRRYARNANRAGVIQLGLGWGSVIGGATLTLKDTSGTTTEAGAGLSYNLGLRAQYGLADFLSAGFYVRKEIGLYVTDEANDFDINGFSAGFEGKVYVVNNASFNLYFAPTIGYYSASSLFNLEVVGQATGLNYGFNAGMNWYWGDVIGMSCDLGYGGSTLNGKITDAEYGDLKYGISSGGFYLGVGMIAKFGGN